MNNLINNDICVGKGKNEIKLATLIEENGILLLSVKRKDRLVHIPPEELVGIIKRKILEFSCSSAS